MRVEFLEHPARPNFSLDLTTLPPEYDVPVPQPLRLVPFDPTTTSRLLVRRYRLEVFNGVPRYVWVGWRQR